MAISMSDLDLLEVEYESLKKRVDRAIEYFETRYAHDSPQSRESAEKEIEKIAWRLREVRDSLFRDVFIDMSKPVSEVAGEMEKHRKEGYAPVGITRFDKARAVVRLKKIKNGKGGVNLNENDNCRDAGKSGL
jgi:hypothetical protein